MGVKGYLEMFGSFIFTEANPNPNPNLEMLGSFIFTEEASTSRPMSNLPVQGKGEGLG